MMRNTRQGLLGSEGSDAPTLQHKREQERSQERIQEEVRAKQERLRVVARAEQELLQDRLMAEIPG